MISINNTDTTKNTINANNTSVAAWPLIPLDRASATLPPFPLEALPTLIRDYVINVAEHTQTHPDMGAMMALGALAICAQGNYEIEGKPGYREPLNLYITVFANPGERKSAVLQLMTRDISQYCIKHNIRLIADDCTPEALVKLLAANNGTMALVSAEGGMMDHMAGRYSGTPNIDVYLKAHCADPIYVDRIGRNGESIQRPTLTIITASQPEVLRQVMANDTFAGRGLLARFLYSSPPSRLGTRKFDSPNLAPNIAAKYQTLITNLLVQSELPDCHVLSLSPDAYRTINDYFDVHESYLSSDGRKLADWGSKYIGAVLRITGLLHLALGYDHRTQVTDTTLAAAISIGKYLLAQAEYAYGLSGHTPIIAQAKIILAHIVKNGFRAGKRHELHALCRCRDIPTAKDMQPALELLEEHGYIRIIDGDYSGHGRRPDMVITTNPAVFDQ